MSIFKKAQGVLGSGGATQPVKSIGPTPSDKLYELAKEAGYKVRDIDLGTAYNTYHLYDPVGEIVKEDPIHKGKFVNPHGYPFKVKDAIRFLESELGRWVEGKEFDSHPIGRVEWKKLPTGEIEISIGGRHREILPLEATDEMLRSKMKELSEKDIENYNTKGASAKKMNRSASKSIEEQFADDYNAKKAKIDKITQAIKLTQSEPKVAEIKTPDGKTKSVFTTRSRDGKPLYVASTDGQNVRQFTNVEDVKDFLS